MRIGNNKIVLLIGAFSSTFIFHLRLISLVDLGHLSVSLCGHFRLDLVRMPDSAQSTERWLDLLRGGILLFGTKKGEHVSCRSEQGCVAPASIVVPFFFVSSPIACWMRDKRIVVCLHLGHQECQRGSTWGLRVRGWCRPDRRRKQGRSNQREYQLIYIRQEAMMRQFNDRGDRLQ